MEYSRFWYLVLATLVTIGMVGYLLFPMFEQIISDQFILTTGTITADVSGTTRSLFEIIFAFPYEKYSGIAGVGLVFFFIWMLRFNKRNGLFNLNQMTDQMFLFVALSVWAITPIFPWTLLLKILPPLAMIQFSWRLFLNITVFLSILGGVYAMRVMISEQRKIRFYGVLIVLLIIPFILNVGGRYISYLTGLIQPVDLSTYNIGGGEYLPVGVNPEQIAKRGEVITSNDEGLEISFSRKGLMLTVDYQGALPSTYVDLPLIYYKGYQVDDKRLNVVKSDEGFVRVQLNGQSEGTFTVDYTGTMLSHIATWISGITVIGVMSYIYWCTRGNGKVTKL